jgi:hypothetical protein
MRADPDVRRRKRFRWGLGRGRNREGTDRHFHSKQVDANEP